MTFWSPPYPHRRFLYLSCLDCISLFRRPPFFLSLLRFDRIVSASTLVSGSIRIPDLCILLLDTFVSVLVSMTGSIMHNVWPTLDWIRRKKKNKQYEYKSKMKTLGITTSDGQWYSLRLTWLSCGYFRRHHRCHRHRQYNIDRHCQYLSWVYKYSSYLAVVSVLCLYVPWFSFIAVLSLLFLSLFWQG